MTWLEFLDAHWNELFVLFVAVIALLLVKYD